MNEMLTACIKKIKTILTFNFSTIISFSCGVLMFLFFFRSGISSLLAFFVSFVWSTFIFLLFLVYSKILKNKRKKNPDVFLNTRKKLDLKKPISFYSYTNKNGQTTVYGGAHLGILNENGRRYVDFLVSHNFLNPGEKDATLNNITDE